MPVSRARFPLRGTSLKSDYADPTRCPQYVGQRQRRRLQSLGGDV